MKLTNPSRLSPNFDLGAWPDSTRIWTLGAMGSSKFIKYITYRVESEFEPYYLNPIWANLIWLDPFFWPWGPTWPNSTEFRVQNRVQPEKNRSGIAALLQIGFHSIVSLLPHTSNFLLHSLMVCMNVGNGWVGWAIAHPDFGRSVVQIRVQITPPPPPPTCPTGFR